MFSQLETYKQRSEAARTKINERNLQQRAFTIQQWQKAADEGR